MPDPSDNPPENGIHDSADARFFRAARKRLGLTQSELGGLLSVLSYVTISRYENGHDPIPRTTLLAMRHLLTMHLRKELRQKRAKAAQDRASLRRKGKKTRP